MSKPARQIICPRHDGIEKPIEEQLSYFRQFVGQSGDLIKTCADVVLKGDRQLSGTKFPAALIADALGESERRTGPQELTALRLELQAHLTKGWAESGFNYFNESYLPEDLDTASTMARLLGGENSRLRADYDERIKRNKLTKSIVPTWLDTDAHDRWFSGVNPFHVDVLLNHWLTELEFGRPVKKEILYDTVQAYGLRNYWYLPALYTPYLYCRLIRRMGLVTESKFIEPANVALQLWREDPAGYQRSSNICPFPKMDTLLSEQPLTSKLDSALQYAISVCCGVDAGGLSEVLDTERSATEEWQTPLYWSLGFKAFASEPVTRAVVLLSLVEFN